MKVIQYRRLIPVLFTVCALMLTSMCFGQETNNQNAASAANVQVPAGQKMDIDGVIQSGQADSIVVRSNGGAIYNVSLATSPEIKEKKNNPFRGAKKFSKTDLVPGLQVEVKGTGGSSGLLVAREIKFKNDDFKMAQTMDTRVVPVENKLKETQNRLNETEQNAQRLSGQVNELSAVSNAARGGAKAAQETADSALSTANNARSLADTARTGVKAANERITTLDDYDVKNTATVLFKVGSAVLSNENRSELEKLAGLTKIERGFLIEVAGFASSDGDEAFNRKLSQKRADAVIQFLAEKYSIPMRRFVTPMGYGESQPVADNTSRNGRIENRRVEVRILVNKGLTQSEISPTTTMNSKGQE